MAGKDSLRSRLTELDEALDKSLALLERGKTPEDCLDRFPERAQELRPLLEVAAQISRVPAPTPPSTDGANGKQRMLEALAQKKAARSGLGARLRVWIDSLFEGGIDAPRLLGSATAAAAVVVLIVVGALAVRSWQGMTVRQEAVLTSQDGLVEVLPLGAEAWLPVSKTMLVEAGDRIRTGAEGSATLTFFDGSVTELRPMAELSIARMTSRRTGGEKVIVLHQWLGEAHNQVEPLSDAEASRFSVQTASAVMSVRGTTFTVIVEPDGTTHLEVEEGVVAVQTRDTSVLVSAGEEILVPSPLVSGTPTPASTSEPSGTSPSPTPSETTETSSATESPEPLALTETSQTPTLEATQTTESVTTPQPTSTEGILPTATEGPAPTATENSRPTATEPSPTETEPSPTETQPSPTETQPSPTETQPSPTETRPSPTETQPPPTETEPPPTETEPSPTETQPPPTETPPPPTETEPPPTEPSPTETRVKETPPGHTNTPEPPGQTKTPQPPGQTKTPLSIDDGADLSSRAGPGALEQDRRSSSFHNASFLVEQLNTGPIWLGILVFFLPLSLLLQDER